MQFHFHHEINFNNTWNWYNFHLFPNKKTVRRKTEKMATTLDPTAHSKYPWNCEKSTGTTIIACEYDSGIIIGADSRSSTGLYVANRFADKLTRLSDYIYCCRSGSAADSQAVTDIVRYHLDFNRMELGREPQLVESAANLLKDLCYTYRDVLMAGMIVAGWDSIKGSQIYGIPLGGMCVRQKVVIGGSGSVYIYGYIDSAYSPDMTEEECLEFVTNAVSLAIPRDGSSGGVVRYGIINEEGFKRGTVLPNEAPQFFQD